MTGGKTNPAAGTRFERRVRDDLAREGYFVLRSPASRGVIDLVALKYGQVLFLQCKINGRLDPVPWNNLLLLADEYGAMAVVAERKGRKLAYTRLTGYKSLDRPNRNPPCEPFVLAEAAG